MHCIVVALNDIIIFKDSQGFYYTKWQYCFWQVQTCLGFKFQRIIFEVVFNIWLFLFQVWGEMWTEESREMWRCAQNYSRRDPQASSNSNWRKSCLQGLPWTIRPWIHTKRSQDYWFHRLLITPLCLIFTYLFVENKHHYLTTLISSD